MTKGKNTHCVKESACSGESFRDSYCMKHTLDKVGQSPISTQKIRQALAVTNAYEQAALRTIERMYQRGYPISEITKALDDSRVSEHTLLVFLKIIHSFNREIPLFSGEKNGLEQKRIQAVENLKEHMTEENLWQCLLLFQNVPFFTAKGLDYFYTIKKTRGGNVGNEIFFSRKEKGITRSTVNIAFAKALELQKPNEQGIPGTINGPKQLGVFGASYLYPIFIAFGVIKKR